MREKHSNERSSMSKFLADRDISYQLQNGVFPSTTSTRTATFGAVETSSAQLNSKLEAMKKKKLQEQQKLKEAKIAQEAAAAAAEEEEQNKTKQREAEENEKKLQEELSAASDSANNNNNLPSSKPAIGEDAIQQTPVPEIDISLHSRSPANLQLLGLVKKIEKGYAGRHYVAELLVETEVPIIIREQRNVKEKEGNDESKDNNEEEKTAVEYQKDIFTVRCFGEEFANLVANSITAESSRVMIQGTYKSNLHIDRTSGKPQAFPFVKVVPPFGSIVVVN
jgi:hypothetical protein